MGLLNRAARRALVAAMLAAAGPHVSAQAGAPASAPLAPVAAHIAASAPTDADRKADELSVHDLSVQVRTAEAAEGQVAVGWETVKLGRYSFWLSVGALALSVVGTGGVLFTVLQSRDATRAARDSADAAAKALNHQQTAATADRINLARSLYLELAHQVARCCYDGENGWERLTRTNGEPALSLRKFTPDEPLIYKSVAARIAEVPGDAAVALISFYYRTEALRRDIENAASAAERTTAENPNVAPDVTGPWFRTIVRRHVETLEPALVALKTLARSVSDPTAINTLSLAHFEGEKPPTESNALVDRLEKLVAARKKK